MDEVLPEPTENDIVKAPAFSELICFAQLHIICPEGIKFDRFVEFTFDVDHRALNSTRCFNHRIDGVDVHFFIALQWTLVRIKRRDAMQCLAQTCDIATCEDQAIVTQDTVTTSAAEQIICANTTDEVVIFRVAKDDVVAGHTPKDIIPRLAVDQITGTARCRQELQEFGAPHIVGRTIDILVTVIHDIKGTHADCLGTITAVNCRCTPSGTNDSLVIIDFRHARRLNDLINFGVVAEDDIGIPRMTLILRHDGIGSVKLHDCASREITIVPGELATTLQDVGIACRTIKQVSTVGAVRLVLRTGVEEEQCGTAANDVILTKTTIDPI